MKLLNESNPKLVKLIQYALERFSSLNRNHGDKSIVSEVIPFITEIKNFIKKDYTGLKKEEIFKIEEDFYLETLETIKIIDSIEKQIEHNKDK